MLKLKVGHQQAVLIQGFQSLAYVASQALGSGTGSGGSGSAAPPGVQRPQNKEQMLAAFKSVFGKK